MKDSVFDRLAADGRLSEALSYLLDIPVDEKHTKSIRCLEPAHHENADFHPSAFICPDVGCVKCGTIGKVYGLVEIAVLRGKAPDAAGAAKLLEEHFYGASGSNGHAAAPTRSAAAWPWFPKTAAALGWEPCTAKDGRPGLRLPTYLPDGSMGAHKRRYEKRSDKKYTAEFEDDGEPGLINLPALIDASAGSDTPSVAVVCGETDLLAWTWACLKEGIAIPAVSSSTGEATSLEPWVRWFSGGKVYFFPDNDKPGREAATLREAELKRAPRALVHTAYVPDPHKDVCDYVRAGGAIRDLLRLTEKTPDPPRKLWTLAEVETAILPPVHEYVGDGLVARGRLTLLVAGPKTGKSLASLHLAKIVASGIGDDWLGSPLASQHEPVLYLCAEGGAQMLQERSRLMHPKVELDNVHLLLDRPFPLLDTNEGLTELATLIGRSKAGLVIIDPLADFRSVADENDNAVAAKFASNLRELALSLDVALLLVHHPSKASLMEGISGSFAGGRGASALFGAVDCEIALRKDRNSGEIHASFSKRYGPPIDPGRRLKLDPDTLQFLFLGDLGPHEQTTKPLDPAFVERSYQALCGFPDWISRDLWAEAAGVSRRTFFRRISEGLLQALPGRVESRHNSDTKTVEFRTCRQP